MKRWRSLCPIPKHSLFLIVAYAPPRAERGNVARSCLHSVGYVTSIPHPSTPTVGPPASTAPSCAAASTPSASPLTTHTPRSESASRLHARRRGFSRPDERDGDRIWDNAVHKDRGRRVGYAPQRPRVSLIDRREDLDPFHRQALLHSARIEGPLQLLQSARSPLGDLRRSR